MKLFEIGYELGKDRQLFTCYVIADNIEDASKAIFDIIKTPFDVMTSSIVCNNIHAISSKCRLGVAIPLLNDQRAAFDKQLFELNQTKNQLETQIRESFPLVSANVEVFKCEICEKEFPSKQLLGIHNYRTHGVKKGQPSETE